MSRIENRKSKIENVLVVGGSGYVASLILPKLPSHFHLRIFDLKPPSFDYLSDPTNPTNLRVTWIPGSVTDAAALQKAAEGCDTLLYMAMGKDEQGKTVDPSPNYDVNIKGLHLALDAAVKAGIKKAIYTSSLSVYDGHLDIRSGATDSEDTPAYPRMIYGFTKLLGEQVCHYFHRTHGIPILILRLFLPVSDEQRQTPESMPDRPNARTPERPDCRTAASDLARALESALNYDHTGIDIIHLTGDTTGRAYHHEKAKRLLHWEPAF